jgi:hypothetical protein
MEDKELTDVLPTQVTHTDLAVAKNNTIPGNHAKQHEMGTLIRVIWCDARGSSLFFSNQPGLI